MSWFGETKDNLLIYRCQELNNSGVIQAFTARQDGNMALHTGDDPENVLKRRQHFLNTLGLQLKCLVAGVQTHSINVRTVTRQSSGAGAYSLDTAIPDTDALITSETGIILSIYTADCLPVFFYDPVTPAIGLAHAGWRGTLHGIARETLTKMTTVFHTDPAQCWVAIGPAIGTECFTVSETVAEQFTAVLPDAVTKHPPDYRIDLSKFNQKLLMNLGVTGERIIASNLCTCCQRNDFYSYRAENNTMGRMMGIISLRNSEYSSQESV